MGRSVLTGIDCKKCGATEGGTSLDSERLGVGGSRFIQDSIASYITKQPRYS